MPPVPRCQGEAWLNSVTQGCSLPTINRTRDSNQPITPTHARTARDRVPAAEVARKEESRGCASDDRTPQECAAALWVPCWVGVAWRGSVASARRPSRCTGPSMAVVRGVMQMKIPTRHRWKRVATHPALSAREGLSQAIHRRPSFIMYCTHTDREQGHAVGAAWRAFYRRFLAQAAT